MKLGGGGGMDDAMLFHPRPVCPRTKSFGRGARRCDKHLRLFVWGHISRGDFNTSSLGWQEEEDTMGGTGRTEGEDNHALRIQGV